MSIYKLEDFEGSTGERDRAADRANAIHEERCPNAEEIEYLRARLAGLSESNDHRRALDAEKKLFERDAEIERLVAMVEAARKALADIACCHGDVPGEGHRTYDRTDMHMRARRAEAELDRIAGGGG